MNRIIIFAAIFLIIFSLVLGVFWFTGSQKSDDPAKKANSYSGNLERSNGNTEPGNVSVDVTLINTQNAEDLDVNVVDLNRNWVFYVEMNTHSVDIVKYKMAEISFLSNGRKTTKAVQWKSDMDGGSHHRNGFLFFKKEADTKELKLVIKGIAGVGERDFTWRF